MRKLLLLACLFLLSACVSSPYRTNEVQTLGNVTRTPQPTNTPIPTATIGYQQTAEVAQATADEARRVNAQATAQHEAILNQQLQMTQVVEQQKFMIAQWTATAAATSVPLTATAQVVANTKVAAVITATHEAPELAQKMVNAEFDKKYGAMSHVASIVATWTISLLSIGFILFLFGKWQHEDKKIRLEEMRMTQQPTPSNMYREDKGQGFFGIHPKKIIPCTQEQFTEFAEAMSDGSKTMGVNSWEGADTAFTRDSYIPFHSWIRENKFGVPNARNGLDPTNELMELLNNFLATGNLPEQYQFAEEIQTS